MFVLLGFASHVAAAMDFSIKALPDGFRMVSAKGAIVSGDTERLRVFLQFADRDRWGTKDIALDSPGGSVDEALSMAALMDRERISTYVLPNALCASACAQVLFFSGIYRVVFDGGKLGLHSCAANGVRDELCNQRIADNAVKHGISYGAVMAYEEQRGPTELAIFSSKDADCWGYTLWPPEYHRGTKPGEPAQCFLKIFKCVTAHSKACH